MSTKKLAAATALSGSIAWHVFIGVQLLAVTAITSNAPKLPTEIPNIAAELFRSPPPPAPEVKPDPVQQKSPAVIRDTMTEQIAEVIPITTSTTTETSTEQSVFESTTSDTGVGMGDSIAIPVEHFVKAKLDRSSYREPKYPVEALRNGTEGEVTLQLLISAEGEVLDVVVIKSSRNRELDNAARAAAKRWRFQAASENGVPQQSLMDFVINFRVNGTTSLDFG